MGVRFPSPAPNARLSAASGSASLDELRSGGQSCRLRTLDAAHRDIAIGDHADQPRALEHGNRTTSRSRITRVASAVDASGPRVASSRLITSSTSTVLFRIRPAFWSGRLYFKILRQSSRAAALIQINDGSERRFSGCRRRGGSRHALAISGLPLIRTNRGPTGRPARARWKGRIPTVAWTNRSATA